MGLRFPPPWFSPRRPPFGGAPFECGSSAGGKTHPRSLTSFVHWGQPHGGHFRLWCRRPSGPPAEISPPLTEHPRSPAVLRGPVARPPAVRVPHGSRASTVAAVHARPSANRSRRLRAWPASLSLAPPGGHWVYAPFAAGRLVRAVTDSAGHIPRQPWGPRSARQFSRRENPSLALRMRCAIGLGCASIRSRPVSGPGRKWGLGKRCAERGGAAATGG